MLHDPRTVRSAFHDAAAAFVDTVSAIDPEQLRSPALGEWTVVELLAHTCRAFTTIETYLVADPDPALPQLGTSADYYRAVFAGSGPELHAQVAERARADVAGLGDDPIVGALEIAQRALAVVHRTPDDHPCATFAGTMTLGAYLPTRLVELVVHTRDLQRATGRLRPVPPTARTVVLQLLVEVADRLEDPDALIDLLTGRAGGDATNVLT